MHQKHLLRFIKSKLRKEPDEVVIFRDGKWLTLKRGLRVPQPDRVRPLRPSIFCNDCNLSRVHSHMQSEVVCKTF